MGAFRDIWGPLGDARGSGGENFHVKNFHQKLDIRKVLFRNFCNNFFCSCSGPMGAFRDIWGPLGDARWSGGEQFFTRRMFPKNLRSEKYFPEFLEYLFLPVWPDGGI